MSCTLKNIYPGSDAILEIKMSKVVGEFKFSDSGIENVIVELYDFAGVSIRNFALNTLADHSSLVPVTKSYDSDGNPLYTTSNDTDLFILYLSGQYHSSSNTKGRIRALYKINKTNTNFSNDNVYNRTIADLTDYNLTNAF